MRLLTRFPTARALALVGLMMLGGDYQPASAQELFCNVSVDYRQLTGSDFGFLDELAGHIEEYLNQQRWTDDRFLEYERIDCSINVVIQEAVTLTRFRAQLILTTRRPVYGTTQNTQVLQIRDNLWEFSYAQGTPLTYDFETYDPLTSVLDFYANLILGYDYDTFSELGGTPYFERARRVAEIGQNQGGGAGWSNLGSEDTRTVLITQLLDPRLEPLRRAYFQYHFNGLDRFVRETDRARGTVLQQLATLQELYQQVGRQYALDLFFNTKYQELAAIFGDSPMSAQAYDLLSSVDPSHMTEYTRLVE